MTARLYEALRRHRGWVLAVAATLVLAAAAGIPRLEVRQDIASLVAESDSEADRAFRDAADTLVASGTLDTLMVEVSKAGADRSTLEAGADALASRLRATGLFADVHFRVDEAARRRVFDVVFPRRFHLVAAPDDYGPGVDAARRDLLSPAAAALKPIIFRDPAGHRDALLARLRLAGPGMALDTSAGTLLSEDGQHALVLAEPKARALLDVDAAQTSLDAIRDATPEGFDVRTLGAHVFATSAAASIKRDVHLTVGATLVGMLLFFAFVFRRVGAVWPLFTPVVAGAAVALGVTGWMGRPVHGIVLGFGAVVVGIAIDYGTHLVVHLRARQAAHPDEPPAAAMGAVFREISGGVTLAAVTTLVAIAAMGLSGSAALRAFARVATLGVGAAFLVAVLVLPGWLGKGVGAAAPGRLAPGLSRRVAGTILVAALALSAWLMPALTDVRFDGDMRNLDYQPESVRALERSFAERYRHPRHASLVVARADDVELALRRAERVASVLEAARAEGELVGYTSIATLVPSERTQATNLESWAHPQRPALERAARAVGMRIAPFEPFFADLHAARSGAVSPLAPGDLEGTPFARLAQRLLVVDAGGVSALAVAHSAQPDVLSVEVIDALRSIPGVEVVSAASVARQAVVSIKASVARLALVSVALVVGLLGVFYRRLTPVLCALLPVAVAIVWTWGAMARFDVPLNLVSIGAFGLVCGLGVDYGVFVTNATLHGAAPAARSSVLLAACTTLLGFAALLLARSPVMWSLGFAVLTGVASALAGAVLVLPALWSLLGRPTGAAEPRGVALQLALALIMASLLTLAWVSGARVTHGWQVAAALALDAAFAAWLVYRMRRWSPDT